MDWVVVERFILRGQAFLPINKEGKGDIVKLIFDEGNTLLVDVQGRTFFNQVLAYFGADAQSIRGRYGPVIGKKQMVPFPLSTQWVLIPFYTRVPIGRQSRTGWIVGQRISEIKEVSRGKSSIALNRAEVLVYHSKRFCQQQLRHARLVLLEYEQVHRGPTYCQETLMVYL